MSKQVPYRLYVSSSFLSLAVVGLGVRLAFLHLGSHEQTRARFDRSRSYERKILAGRGAIHDCHGDGNVLAMNLGVKNICIDPATTSKGEGVIKTACELAELLNVPADEVAVRMKQPNRRFAYVKRFVPTDVADEVDALDDAALAAWLTANPKVIQRPIVVSAKDVRVLRGRDDPPLPTEGVPLSRAGLC